MRRDGAGRGGADAARGRRSARAWDPRRARPLAWALVLAAIGCSASYYRESADREVYGIIAEKQEEALGASTSFTIEPQVREILEAIPRAEDGTPRLSLRDALAVALAHSRRYQTEKEDVYLAGLSLTGVRYRYAPNFFATLAGTISGTKDASSGSASAAGGWSQLLTSGATTTFRLATSLFRAFTSNPGETASSVLSASFVQPILRGAGARIAAEALTQGERDAIYAVRTFERFRRTFCVSIASEYYRVLQSRDEVENAGNNYRSLRTNRERSELMARAGRLPDFEVDQARSSEFRAEDSWVRTQRNFEDALDQFKLTLGIPTDTPLELEPGELDRMAREGLRLVEMDVEEAVRTAIDHRLDLANTRDGMADAARKVEVARDSLRPGLDLQGSIWVPSEPTQPGKLRFEEFTYQAGADLDLPVDRLDERNAYRSSLITLERQRRSYQEQEDSVKLEVRRAHRGLAQARRTYQIQLLSLRLAERRVESTRLLLQAGRVQTRDLLESQDALLEAQNAVTRALVDYTIARLEFFRDLGVLRIGEDGMWIEEGLPGVAATARSGGEPGGPGGAAMGGDDAGRGGSDASGA